YCHLFSSPVPSPPIPVSIRHLTPLVTCLSLWFVSPMTLPQLIQDTPLIHNERTRTWAIDDDLAKFLHENLEPGHITLETGSGLSTLVILGKRVAHHIAVSPVADELEVIRSFCL